MGESPLFHPPPRSGLLLLFLRRESFLPFLGGCMARCAEVSLFSLEKLLLRGRMGLVAVEASGLVNQGPVDSVFPKNIVHQAAVTTPAQLKTRSSCRKWGGGRSDIMTLVASFARHRSMNSVEKNAGCVRAVRIMAGDAVRLGDRIVHMLRRETGAVRLVAFNAEPRDRALEQMG